MRRPRNLAGRAIDLFRREGARGVLARVRDRRRAAYLERLSPEEEYELWIRTLTDRETGEAPGVRGRGARLKVSILVVGGDDEAFEATASSVQGGRRADCTVARGLAGAAHDRVAADWWIGVAGGDRFVAGAIDALVLALEGEEGTPSPGLVYGDELLLEGERGVTRPFLKPAWSPLLSLTLPGRFPGSPTAIAGPLARALYPECSAAPAPWFDLVLRASERAGSIVHLPRPLVVGKEGPERNDRLWGTMAARAASVAAALSRRGLSASIEPGEAPESLSLLLHPPGDPLVSILLPTRNEPRFLGALLRALRELPEPPRRELLILDHDSDDPEAIALIGEAVARDRARVIPIRGPFNFSRMINTGAREASGGLFLLLNNDVEPLRPDWLKRLVGLAGFPGAAAVGARLLYPDGTFQHAGIALGVGTIAGHLDKGGNGRGTSPFVTRLVAREVSAVTGACLLVHRDAFFATGGLDEAQLRSSFNDVDLCLRLTRLGHSVLYEPACVLLHHETMSRDPRLDPGETRTMRTRWGRELENDPYLSPAMSRLLEAPHLDLWSRRSTAPRASNASPSRAVIGDGPANASSP